MLGKNVIIYPCVSGYFWIRNFSFADSSPTRIRCNPQLFVSALQSENVEYTRYEIRIFFYPVMSQDRAKSFTVNIQGGAVRNVMASLLLGLQFQVCNQLTNWEWIWIRIDGQIRFEYPTCGRGNFWIRKEQFADSKYSDTCGRAYIKHLHHQAGAPSDFFSVK